MVTLKLYGRPSVNVAGGRDVTPRSAKAVALLALLATSNDHSRGRRWCETMLWPEQTPEKASGSLRQVLHILRKSMGDHHIETNRSFIRLVDVEWNDTAGDNAHEFLEGIDVDEPAFNDWLSAMRGRDPEVLQPKDTQTPTPQAPQLNRRHFLTINAANQDLDRKSAFLCTALSEAIGSTVSEFGEIEVFEQRTHDACTSATTATTETGLNIEVDVIPHRTDFIVRISLKSATTGRIYWTHRANTPEFDGFDTAWFQELTFRAVEATYAATATAPETAYAEAHVAKALRSMFRFDRANLSDAETHLEQAISMIPSSNYHAWKVMLHQIKGVEQSEGNWQNDMELGRAHIAHAEAELKPSALTSALLAQGQVMLNNNPEIAQYHANQAKALNPANPFVYSAIASVELRRGENKAGFAAALRGVELAGATSYAAWWHLMAGLSALKMEALEIATDHFHKAHLHAPSFRAPLRHLFALSKAIGTEEDAEKYKCRLQACEPNFSVDRLKGDPDYPASTLRTSSLLAKL